MTIKTFAQAFQTRAPLPSIRTLAVPPVPGMKAVLNVGPSDSARIQGGLAVFDVAFWTLFFNRPISTRMTIKIVSSGGGEVAVWKETGENLTKKFNADAEGDYTVSAYAMDALTGLVQLAADSIVLHVLPPVASGGDARGGIPVTPVAPAPGTGYYPAPDVAPGQPAQGQPALSSQGSPGLIDWGVIVNGTDNYNKKGSFSAVYGDQFEVYSYARPWDVNALPMQWQGIANSEREPSPGVTERSGVLATGWVSANSQRDGVDGYKTERFGFRTALDKRIHIHILVTQRVRDDDGGWSNIGEDVRDFDITLVLPEGASASGRYIGRSAGVIRF